jgi:hypothetical protein
MSSMSEPTAEYTSNPARLLLNLVGSVFVAAMGVIMLIGGLVTAFSGGSNAFPFAGLGLIYAVPGALWLIGTIRKRDLRVVVFPEGLSYTKGGKTDFIAWDDIETVWQTITRVQGTFTVRSCKIQLRDGTKIKFTNALRNVAGLITVVQREVTSRILDRARKTYLTGGTVSFGKFDISKAGISQGSRTLPWEQVSSVTVDKGVVTIKKEGRLLKWASATVAETPNFFVFAHLVGSQAPGSVDLALLAMSVLGSTAK